MALALTTGSLTAFAAVFSTKTHAVVRVEANATNVLIAVPWSAYTQDGSGGTALPVNHLVRPTNLEDGDMLLSVTAANDYSAWMLLKDASGVGHWEAATTVQSKNQATAPAGLSSISSTKASDQLPIGFQST